MEKIGIKTDFILLGQFLKFIGVISNGGEAKMFLLENEVLVNNLVENRRGKKLFVGDFVEICGKKYVISADVD